MELLSWALEIKSYTNNATHHKASIKRNNLNFEVEIIFRFISDFKTFYV